MYYKHFAEMYRNSSADTRKASKAHWIKVHSKNLKSKRNDLIMFSASILAMITMVENEEQEEKRQ